MAIYTIELDLDFKLLTKQKRLLNDLACYYDKLSKTGPLKHHAKKKADMFDGLVNLIDSIQDQLVDDNKMNEHIVFPYLNKN